MTPTMPYRLRRMLDRLTRLCTAVRTFDELINLHPNYCPSIYPHPGQPFSKRMRRRCLAEQYDVAQAARNDPRRSYRGSRFWE